MVQKIRNEGTEAEQRFDNLVPSSTLSDSPKNGDRLVQVDGRPHYVEIKRCTAPRDRAGTINQVRAIKYIPCAIWAKVRELWYVVPADVIVLWAATKARGQHNEIPFECMNLSLPRTGGKNAEIWNSFASSDENLAKCVENAIRRGNGSPALRHWMEELHRELRSLNRKYRQLPEK